MSEGIRKQHVECNLFGMFEMYFVYCMVIGFIFQEKVQPTVVLNGLLFPFSSHFLKIYIYLGKNISRRNIKPET